MMHDTTMLEQPTREELQLQLREERRMRHELEVKLWERDEMIRMLQQQIHDLKLRLADFPSLKITNFIEDVSAAEMQEDTIGQESIDAVNPSILNTNGVNSTEKMQMYSKSTGFADMSGEWYEIKMAMLLFLRGLNYTHDFCLATNFDGAGIFDDIVFKYTIQTNLGELKSRICFLQLKHKQRAVITYSKIFGPKGAFSLANYFKSYYDVKKTIPDNPAFKFCGDFDDFEFILYTNAESQLELAPCDRRCCSKEGSIFTSNAASQTICESALSAIVEVMAKYKSFLIDLRRLLGKTDMNDGKDIVCEAIDSLGELAEQKDIAEKLLKLTAKPCKDEVEKLLKEIEPWGDLTKYPEFLKKFKMLTGQASESQLDKLIKQEIFKMFQTSDLETDSIFADFKDKMQNWWKDGNSNYYLTKSAPLWLDVLKCRIADLSSRNLQSLRNSNIRYCSDYLQALYLSFSECTVLNIYSSGKSTKLTSLKVYQSIKQLDSRNYLFLDLQTCLNRQGEVLSIWQSVWCDTLIIECDTPCNNVKTMFDSFSKVVHKYKQKKIIFVTLPADVKLSDGIRQICCSGYSEIHDIFKLTNLCENSQSYLLDKGVNFQGFVVSLKELIGEHLELKEAISPEIVDSLLTGEVLTIGEELPNVVEYYVPRVLQQQHALKIRVLKEIDLSVVFLITGMTKDELIKLVPPFSNPTNYSDCYKSGIPNKCRYFVVSDDLIDIAFCDLCRKFEEVLLVEYKEGCLLWKKSQGDMTAVTKHIIKEDVTLYDLQNLIQLPDRTFLLVAEPGMGKSTFLTYITKYIKENDPSLWVLKISLNDYTSYLNNINFDHNQDTALEFLETVANLSSQKNPELLKMLLRYSYLFTGKLVILLDGFDEVCPNYTTKVVKLLRLFMTSRIKRLWITSRPVMRNKLMYELGSLPFTLKPFTVEDQVLTLKKFWKCRITDDNKADVFITQLLHHTAQYLNDRDMHFTGIPLQTLLLGEVFENDLLLYQESTQFDFHEVCDLFVLYDRFIEKKWDVYLSEKKKEDTSNIGVKHDNENLKNIFMTNHMIAALLKILPVNDIDTLKCKDLHIRGPQYVGRIKEGYDHTGIIMGITDGVPTFVHRTFAEYFTAMWFAENFLDNKDFIQKNFFESSFEIVKSNFDRILADGIDLHVAVLRHDLGVMKKILNEGVDVNTQDKGGRTALHLAASLPRNSEMIKLLLSFGADVTLRDKILEWSSLRYADRVKSWSTIGILLELGGNADDLVVTKQIFSDGDYLISALHIAVKEGYVELLKYLLYSEKYVNITVDNNKCSLLHVAANNGQEKVAKLLLVKGANVFYRDKKENTALHFASKNGHLNVVQCLVEHMENTDEMEKTYSFCIITDGINAQDKEGRTPLFLAAEYNNLDVVKYLVEKNVKVDLCSRDGYCPLYIALLKGNLNIVHYLKNKIPFDKDSKNGWTLMHTAATNGQLNVVKHLIEIGANIDVQNKYGQTPLHIASKKNNLEVLEYLLNQGASVNIADSTFGWTPLNYAVKEGYLEVTEILLKAGANFFTHEEIESYSRSVNCMADQEMTLHKQKNGWAPLYLACGYGHLPIIEMLINKGIGLNSLEKTSGKAALHVAAEKNHLNVAKLLIVKGANINIQGKVDGQTPLHIATQAGHVEMVMLLIEKGADMEVNENSNGQTPLHFAAWCDRSDIARLLINKGANVSVSDNSGWTPLHLAAQNNHLAMSQLLIEKGADINACTKLYGWTPLHYAAKYGRLDIVKYLIQKHALLDVADTIRWRTPLHVAVENSHLQVVRQLIQGGATITMRDKDGMMPLDIAVAQQDAIIMDVLRPLKNFVSSAPKCNILGVTDLNR